MRSGGLTRFFHRLFHSFFHRGQAWRAPGLSWRAIGRLTRGRQDWICNLTRRRRAIIAFCDRGARRVGHRGPMLFGNPFSVRLYSAHQCATKLAGVGSPLLPVSVFGKNFLQVITKLTFTRLDWCWHHSPIHKVRCSKPELRLENWRDGYCETGVCF